MIGMIRGVVVVAVLVGALTSCSGGNGEPVQDPQAVLDGRLTSQEITARYEQMEQRIRDQLNAELGPFTWENYPTHGRESTCGGDFTALDGMKEVTMQPWFFKGGISDADWPRAKRIVNQVIAEYGFTTPTLQIDKPGYHETSAVDLTLGAHFNMGTEANTSMQTTTGCHRGDFR